MNVRAGLANIFAVVCICFRLSEQRSAVQWEDVGKAWSDVWAKMVGKFGCGGEARSGAAADE